MQQRWLQGDSSIEVAEACWRVDPLGRGKPEVPRPDLYEALLG